MIIHFVSLKSKGQHSLNSMINICILFALMMPKKLFDFTKICGHFQFANLCIIIFNCTKLQKKKTSLFVKVRFLLSLTLRLYFFTVCLWYFLLLFSSSATKGHRKRKSTDGVIEDKKNCIPLKCKILKLLIFNGENLCGSRPKSRFVVILSSFMYI